MDNQLRTLQLTFLEEAMGFLEGVEDSLMNLEAQGFDEDMVNQAFRFVHNFKGSAKSVGFDEMGRLAHAFEDMLQAVKSRRIELSSPLISLLLKCSDELRTYVEQHTRNHDFVPQVDETFLQLKNFLEGEIPQGGVHDVESNQADAVDAGFGFFEDAESSKNESEGGAAKPALESVSRSKNQAPNKHDESLKIPASRLDSLLNIIGEVVVNQSILEECTKRKSCDSQMAIDSINYMSKLVSDLQSLSLSLRLVPIKPLFQKLRRTARDVATGLHKNISFEEDGEYCEVDKKVIEVISDPLNHMIRNAIDHGIESPEQRREKGKSEVARVQLKAEARDDQFKIIISDDGRGMDRQKIMAKARLNHLPVNDAMSDSDVFKLIFLPGFSTAEKVTDVSGRGVGMEVVQNAIDELKGTIEIKSEVDKGTEFIITLPLSLSIVGGLVVRVNDQKYIVPVSQLIETIELSKYGVSTVTGTSRVADIRGEIVPIYDLGNILVSNRIQRNLVPRNASSSPALITSHRGKKVTFQVDEILSQQKVVLKPLGKDMHDLPGIVAGAVLSNGEPGLVLSLDKLIA